MRLIQLMVSAIPGRPNTVPYGPLQRSPWQRTLMHVVVHEVRQTVYQIAWCFFEHDSRTIACTQSVCSKTPEQSINELIPSAQSASNIIFTTAFIKQRLSRFLLASYCFVLVGIHCFFFVRCSLEHSRCLLVPTGFVKWLLLIAIIQSGWYQQPTRLC